MYSNSNLRRAEEGPGERDKRMHQKYLKQIAELKAAYTALPQTNPAASSPTFPTTTSYPTSTPPPSVSNYRYPPSHHSIGPQGPLVQPWDLHSSQSSTQMSGTFSSHAYSGPRQAHLSQVSPSHSQEVAGEFYGCNSLTQQMTQMSPIQLGNRGAQLFSAPSPPVIPTCSRRICNLQPADMQWSG
jgi:hypothetical protein